MSTITFKTAEQAAIFEHELKGQISDGMWENTPGTDYQKWCAAEVQVGDDIGRDFAYVRKQNFDFARRDLVEVVGDRMLRYAQVARAFGLVEDLSVLGDHGIVENGKWRLPSHTGDYWDRLRHTICRYNPQEFAAKMATAEAEYGMEELMRDLRAIKRTIRIVKP